MSSKRNLINWARSCHFDSMIVVKEIKGKRWMGALSHIESLGNFDIDDYSSLNDSWGKILETINKMTNEELVRVDKARERINIC